MGDAAKMRRKSSVERGSTTRVRYDIALVRCRQESLGSDVRRFCGGRLETRGHLQVRDAPKDTANVLVHASERFKGRVR